MVCIGYDFHLWTDKKPNVMKLYNVDLESQLVNISQYIVDLREYIGSDDYDVLDDYSKDVIQIQLELLKGYAKLLKMMIKR